MSKRRTHRLVARASIDRPLSPKREAQVRALLSSAKAQLVYAKNARKALLARSPVAGAEDTVHDVIRAVRHADSRVRGARHAVSRLRRRLGHDVHWRRRRGARFGPAQVAARIRSHKRWRVDDAMKISVTISYAGGIDYRVDKRLLQIAAAFGACVEGSGYSFYLGCRDMHLTWRYPQNGGAARPANLAVEERARCCLSTLLSMVTEITIIEIVRREVVIL